MSQHKTWSYSAELTALTAQATAIDAQAECWRKQMQLLADSLDALKAQSSILGMRLAQATAETEAVTRQKSGNGAGSNGSNGEDLNSGKLLSG